MTGLIRDAEIHVYPNAAHGFLFQYPNEVADEISEILARSRQILA